MPEFKLEKSRWATVVIWLILGSSALGGCWIVKHHEVEMERLAIERAKL